MATNALHGSATMNRKESFKEKFLKVCRESRLNMICGLLLLNGSPDAYSLFKELSE